MIWVSNQWSNFLKHWLSFKGMWKTSTYVHTENVEQDILKAFTNIEHEYILYMVNISVYGLKLLHKLPHSISVCLCWHATDLDSRCKI